MTKGIIIASTDDFAPYFSSSDGTEAGRQRLAETCEKNEVWRQSGLGRYGRDWPHHQTHGRSKARRHDWPNGLIIVALFAIAY